MRRRGIRPTRLDPSRSQSPAPNSNFQKTKTQQRKIRRAHALRGRRGSPGHGPDEGLSVVGQAEIRIWFWRESRVVTVGMGQVLQKVRDIRAND